jgi:hypothetical protein
MQRIQNEISKERLEKDTFPKGETSCWSAVILSPSFSFLTCTHDNQKQST